MNNMASNPLTDLAARVEAAEGPDRELDKTIHRDVMGFCLHPFDRLKKNGAQSDTGFDCLDCGADSWGNKGRKGERLHDPIPTYTASLDAALTLLPDHEGIGWRMTDGAGGPTAEVWCFDFDTGTELFHVGAMPTATPALALTAACLRARATGAA